MSDLRSALERAAESFEPTANWLRGSIERSRKRTRARRLTAGVVGLAVSAASSAILLSAFWTDPDSHPAGTAALTHGVSCDRTWSEFAADELTPGGFLSVSATAPNDVWAVGPDEAAPLGSHTIIHHWDGAAWQRLPSPDGATGDQAVNELHDVFAVAPDDVWAVGKSVEIPGWGGTPSRVLVEHWDGSTWSIVPAPSPYTGENQLNGVSGTAPDDVWAVGFALDDDESRATTLAMHWDGAEWSIVRTDDLRGASSGASFDAVEAISADDVWAVGSQPSGALIEHWDGTSWTVVAAPDPTEHAFLTDLDARAPDDIWAVGWASEYDPLDPGEYGYPGVSERSVPVIEHFDGSVWSFVEVPAAPEPDVVPLAVAALARDDVWVAGWMGTSEVYAGTPGPEGTISDPVIIQEMGPLLLHWDGEEWRYEDIPVTGSGIFFDISEGYHTAWLMGRAGGTYDEHGYVSGDRPLVFRGTC